MFMVVVLLIIVLVIIFIIYRVSRADLKNVRALTSPVKLYERGSGPFKFDRSRLPVTLNGQEYAFSFWLYLAEATATADHKLLLMRGRGSASIEGASPVVFLDRTTNKLYVSALTNQSRKTTGEIIALNDLLNKGNQVLTATVEYVPLQRWVHYVVVVADNLLTVYQDGDLYTVENVMELPVKANGPRPVIRGIDGDLYVGATNSSTTKGLVAKVDYFNYALTPQMVRSLYDQGPTPNTMLSRFGVPEYGVRSPVYRLDQANNEVTLG